MEWNIRGEDSSGSDLETNVSNLIESSKHAESTLVPVEPEKEKGDGSDKAQNSEDSTPADLPTLGNPFLPSPEKGNGSAEASPVITRSKCQKSTEYWKTHEFRFIFCFLVFKLFSIVLTIYKCSVFTNIALRFAGPDVKFLCEF